MYLFISKIVYSIRYAQNESLDNGCHTFQEKNSFTKPPYDVTHAYITKDMAKDHNIRDRESYSMRDVRFMGYLLLFVP